MTKFLLIILIAVTGLKLITYDGALVYKYTAVKFTFHDEESKNENDKNENGKRVKGKCDNEDVFYPFCFLYSLRIDPVQVLPSFYNHHKLSPGFVNKPYTPPDLT